MKLTNGSVFLCREPLQHITNRDDIPIKYAMPLVKMAKKLGEEIDLISERRNRLITKYGEEKDGNVGVDPTGENWGKFIKDLTELMELETEVNISPVKIPDNIIIPTKDLIALEPFLEVVGV